MEVRTFAEKYLEEAAAVIAQLDRNMIEKVAGILAETRASGGRMFILGVGGSAANASHAVNDFSQDCGH
jgi:D-sedoheptulose 7-phosphate isomerase